MPERTVRCAQRQNSAQAIHPRPRRIVARIVARIAARDGMHLAGEVDQIGPFAQGIGTHSRHLEVHGLDEVREEEDAGRCLRSGPIGLAVTLVRPRAGMDRDDTREAISRTQWALRVAHLEGQSEGLGDARP